MFTQLKRLKLRSGRVNVFGNSKTDKNQDKTLKAIIKKLDGVIKNQNVMIKNGAIYNDWIQHLNIKNKAQDRFDHDVVESLKAQNVKIGSVLELQQQVKELTGTVNKLLGEVKG